MLEDLLSKVEKRIGKVEKSSVINNAVDLNKFHPDTDAGPFLDTYLPGNKRLITFLGVLGPHIDLDTMLETTRQLKDRDDVHFLFVGSGAQKETLDNTLKNPDFAHATAIDWLDYSLVPAFWSASYVNFWALHQNELDKMRFQAKTI